MLEQQEPIIEKAACFLYQKKLSSDGWWARKMNQMFLQSVSILVWLRENHSASLWCDFLSHGKSRTFCETCLWRDRQCRCIFCKVQSSRMGSCFHQCISVKIHSVTLPLATLSAKFWNWSHQTFCDRKHILMKISLGHASNGRRDKLTFNCMP